MLVQILVIAGALAIMSAVVLPGHLPARGTGHGDPDHQGAVAASGSGNVVGTVLLVLILCLLVSAGFCGLVSLSGK